MCLNIKIGSMIYILIIIIFDGQQVLNLKRKAMIKNSFQKRSKEVPNSNFEWIGEGTKVKRTWQFKYFNYL